ncbi:MAG: hypothetical protein LUQ67_04235 [Methanomicrobiales archaeon]|nr:hypothetical protein [Methanomicrobiales archaeon]
MAAATYGTAAVTGNPKITVSIALNLSSIFLDLDPAASPATNASLAILVSSNTGSFYINVNDSSGRAGGDLGYMGNYTGAGYDPINTKLAAALNLAGTTNTTGSTTTAQGLSYPIQGAQALYTGSGKVSDQLLVPNTFSQVVAYSDDRLPSPSVYRMDLTFEIGAT